MKNKKILNILFATIAAASLSSCDFGNDSSRGSSYTSPSSSVSSTIPQYSALFNLNPYGENKPANQYLSQGALVTEPTAPSRQGYDFEGWYLSSDCSGEKWDFTSDTLSSSVMLYAHWVIQEYQMTFDLAGGDGTLPEPQTRNYFSYDEVNAELTCKVSEPSVNPTKVGYTFAGWWVGDSVDNYTQEWNFSSDFMDSDVTLYAGWGIVGANADYSYIELANCIKLTGYINDTFPETLTMPTFINEKPVLSIAKDSFKYIESSYDIVLPDLLTTINDSAFAYSTSVGEMVIPDSVTSVGKMAFQGCDQMYSLTIGSGVKNIGEKAFYQCTSLRYTGTSKLIIPENVISIEDDAFSIVSLEGQLYNIQFNEGLVFIGERAFNYAYIYDFYAPNSLEIIGREAFCYCRYLTRVDFGVSLRVIGYEAFHDCNSGLYITMANESPIPILGETFGTFPLEAGEPTRTNLWIMVPNDTAKAAYKAAENWSLYSKHIISYSIVGLIIYPTRP